MKVIYTYTPKGIQVQVGKAVLPGFFLGEIQAEKAANKYIGLIRQSAKNRKNGKE